MATGASLRESRRRKIIDRGSERLALISGRIHSLPPESHVDQAPPPVPPCCPTQSPSNATASPVAEEDSVSSVGGLKPYAFDGRNGGIEAVRSPAPDAIDGVESLMSKTSSISAPGAAQGSEFQTCRHENFNPKRISSAVDASKKIRLLCSVIVAILVVISNLRFPLLGSQIVKSIVGFRPLFLVLLTNLTVVAMRVLLDGHEGCERSCRVENGNGSAEEYWWPEQVGKALEVGLTMQKVINALLMDCSVFAVVLVCGLCFI